VIPAERFGSEGIEVILRKSEGDEWHDYGKKSVRQGEVGKKGRTGEERHTSGVDIVIIGHLRA
jgi:hypothetical protein